MKNLLTKKNTLIISISSFFLIVTIFYFVKSDFCYHSQACRALLYSQTSEKIILSFLYLCSSLSLLVLPFSVLTYKMHNEIFNFWLKFATGMIPIVIFSSYFIYHSVGGQDPYRGGGIIFLLSIVYVIYFLLSLGVIFYKYFKLKK